MKFTNEQKAEIKDKFASITNVEQFCELLCLVYKAIDPEPKKPFSISVNEILYFSINKEYNYLHFTIPKKNGEQRSISAPVKRLKFYQRLINELLNVVFQPHKAAFGFVPGKNIVDNSKKHLSKKFVYNIDLENFFSSIKFRRVKSVLGLQPFNLSGEREKIAFVIANICCAKGCLPQGAPTSPTLTNIICQRLDRKLALLAKDSKAAYSRYADDITFSSYHEIFNNEFRGKLKLIIEQEKFSINEKKVRLQSRSERQSVTGIVVNSKSNLNKAYINRIRFWLYIWKKFGYNKAYLRFNNDYLGQFRQRETTNMKSLYDKERFAPEKGMTKYNGRVPEFKKVLDGKINFLTMVRGKEDKMALNYREQWKILNSQPEKQSVEVVEKEAENISHVFDVWENNGIEKAIELYKSKYES